MLIHEPLAPGPQVSVYLPDVERRVGDPAQAQDRHDAVDASPGHAARGRQVLDPEGHDLVGVRQPGGPDAVAKRVVDVRVGLHAVDVGDAPAAAAAGEGVEEFGE